MIEILEVVDRCTGPECCIKSYDGWRLDLYSGTSLEHAKPLVAFFGVSYVACPTEFSHPEFRLASAAEREAIAKVVPVDEYDHVAVIEAETMSGLGRHVFFIVASSAEVLTPAALPGAG